MYQCFIVSYLASSNTVSRPRSSPHIFKPILVQTRSFYTVRLNNKIQITVVIVQNNMRLSTIRTRCSRIAAVAGVLSMILAIRFVLAVVLIVFLLIHCKQKRKRRKALFYDGLLASSRSKMAAMQNNSHEALRALTNKNAEFLKFDTNDTGRIV